jgi:hypothetical protein
MTFGFNGETSYGTVLEASHHIFNTCMSKSLVQQFNVERSSYGRGLFDLGYHRNIDCLVCGILFNERFHFETVQTIT